MLVDFFFKLRGHGVSASITEFLSLLDAMRLHVASASVDEFYYLSRAALVKDERHFDRFDRAFASYFKGIEDQLGEEFLTIPDEWLRKQAELYLSEEQKKEIESLGGLDSLLETLKERLQEQDEQHHGGSKWIGTAGTSPFGAYGYNPEGVRIGQQDNRSRRAAKVWDRREFRNLDDTVELGTRNIKVALRKLRRFAREGAATELDLHDTIACTARNAGFLDLRLVAERHNAVKVLLFLDVGGSMNTHVRACEELFSASRNEFKHLEYFYFHNCLYESVWRDNRRRYTERIPTVDVLRTYAADYKVIFVGDASMGPYEITDPGGSVEHFNSEAGGVWLQRALTTFPCSVWLNPEQEEHWSYTPSTQMIGELVGGRMFPLTLDGLDRAIESLKRTRA